MDYEAGERDKCKEEHQHVYPRYYLVQALIDLVQSCSNFSPFLRGVATKAIYDHLPYLYTIAAKVDHSS